MKIVRNGIEYELTEEELSSAYCEKEHLFDVEFVKNECEYNSDFENLSDEEKKDAYDDIAYEMRHQMDHYGISDFDALAIAVNKYFSEKE